MLYFTLKGDLTVLNVLLLMLVVPAIVVTPLFLMIFFKRRQEVKAFQREITDHLDLCGQELRNNETLH